jgi:hypothetical protein
VSFQICHRILFAVSFAEDVGREILWYRPSVVSRLLEAIDARCARGLQPSTPVVIPKAVLEHGYFLRSSLVWL